MSDEKPTDEQPESAEVPEIAKTVKKGKVDPASVGATVEKQKRKPAPKADDDDEQPPAAPPAPAESFTDSMMRAFPLFG